MSLVNFYEEIPKKYLPDKQTYSNYPKLRIDLPFRMLIIGTSGSMKTNLVLNLISNIMNFTKIYLFAKDLEEPLYKYIIDELRKSENKLECELLVAGNTADLIPSPDEFDKNENNLIIFDDLILEKDLNKVSEIFIRGRKKNISAVFISQSYFDIPKIIRGNANYIILKKINNENDLKLILREHKLGVNKQQLESLYNQAVSGHDLDFFMIDKQTLKPNYKFRFNFDPIY